MTQLTLESSERGTFVKPKRKNGGDHRRKGATARPAAGNRARVFDDCEALSVAAGDIKPATTDESTDEETVLFRWRRGARTALRACRGEGNLRSAAHVGRLVRLKMAGG